MRYTTTGVLALCLIAMLAACSPSRERGGPVTTVAATAVPGPAATSVPASRWRALLVAGDDASPAFDNGVDAMRATLQMLGVPTIAALTSMPEQVAPGRALATTASLNGSLRATGAVSGDACLVFLTSHGDTGGLLLRRSRALYSPVQLEAALTAGCGAAPTVVVVSACHSGTFLTDAMRKPNRVVLTAARRDRSSFGCGAASRYTYFDACLVDAMQGATTWRDVHARATSCVSDLEGKLGAKPPSLPQAFFGAAVSDLRLPGR